MGMCCTDYDMPEFCETNWHKARKGHRCCECYQTIHIGQQYQHVAGKWEGDFLSFKTCEKCADLRESLMDVACPAFEGLTEAYRDYLENIGTVRYDEETDRYIYPENHLKLND